MKWNEDISIFCKIWNSPCRNLAGLPAGLAKSVERHTRSGGRQGYLRFIERFLQ